MHLVGLIIRTYHDARSPERQIINVSGFFAFRTRHAKRVFSAPYRIVICGLSVLYHIFCTLPRKFWSETFLIIRRTGRHFTIMYTVIPRLTKIIRSGITFVSRNLR